MKEIGQQPAALYNCNCNTQKALEKQRDQLLEALQNVLKAGRGSSGRIILEQEDELQIIAAIAKAKG